MANGISLFFLQNFMCRFFSGIVCFSFDLRLLANNIDLLKSLDLQLCRILKLTTALKEQVKVHVA